MGEREKSAYTPLLLLNLLGMLIVAAAILLFIYTGLTEPTGAVVTKFSMPLDYVVEDQKTRTITLPGSPERMTATAKAYGNGRVGLFLKANGQTYSMIDEVIDGEASLSQACIDSCAFDPETPQFQLEGIVYGPVVLEIQSLTFWITPESNNSAPVWKGPTLFSISERTVIDLDKYFYDKEGQTLQYSSSGEGVAVTIKDGNAVVNMDPGTRKLDIVAYDGIEAGMAHLTLER